MIEESNKHSTDGEWKVSIYSDKPSPPLKVMQKSAFEEVDRRIKNYGFNDFYEDNGYKSKILVHLLGVHATYYNKYGQLAVHSPHVSRKKGKVDFTFNLDFTTDTLDDKTNTELTDFVRSLANFIDNF